MEKHKKPATDPAILRQKAEELLNKKPLKPRPPLSEFEALKLVHELEVHQIELEMQNEELLRVKVNAAELAAEKYAELYEFAPSGYFTLSGEGEIVELNQRMAKMLGKERSRLLKNKFGLFVSDETKPTFNVFLGKVFSGRDIETCELTMEIKDKQLMYLHLSGTIDDTGEQCLVTAIDHTELKLAEESLKISLAKYQFLFNSFPLGITITDKTGNIVESNIKAEQLLGLSEEEQTKRQIDGSEWRIIQMNGEPFPPEEYASVRALKENRLIENIEMGIVKGENDICWINVTAAPVPIENYGIAIAYNDITERKRAEAALTVSEEHFHSLFNNMSEGVALHELVFADGKPVNYRIADVNNPFLKIIGVSREQIVGKLATEAYGTPNPPYFEEYARVGISKTPLNFETYFAPLDKHFAISVAPWQGNGFATIFTDISDRRKAEDEIKRSNEELQKINAEKDKFFSIIAHDLRSPFSGFLGLTQMMAEELSNLTMAQIQELAIGMKNSATNLYGLLENLLKWSMVQLGSIPFNPGILKLCPMIEECITTVIESAKIKGIEISSTIPINTEVRADSNMLQTIIRNLLSNALKFTTKGGKIYVSAKTDNNNGLEISIQDTGIGMSQTIVENLFRFDVDTNRKGTEGEPSTGLGLILCKEFVEKHGGKIWVKSEDGKGSTLYFTLPNHPELNESKIV